MSSNQKTETRVNVFVRRNKGGRISIVRKTQPSMLDRLTNPYAQGIYTGAAAVGLITGMAMMARREGAENAANALAKAKFSLPDRDKRSTSVYSRRSKNGKISIISKQSSSNPFPLIRDWEDIERDPLGISPIVNYYKRLQLISEGNKKAIALNKSDPWGMKAFDKDGM
jgi:hypothetical protein